MNEKAAILEATSELLSEMVLRNQISPDRIASIFFTATPDLNAVFPAEATRGMGPGWNGVPLLCAQEIEVPGSMDRIIRVLMHVNWEEGMGQPAHVYLRETSALRPDLETCNLKWSGAT